MTTTTFAVDMIGIEDAPELPLLDTIERQALDRCEAIIERGAQTFREVGDALAEIRDKRLYRQHYDRWEEYCQDRWGIGGSRARQLIGASGVARQIESVTTVTLSNEAQARAAGKAPTSMRGRVAERAAELAGDSALTTRHIEAAVREIELPIDFSIVQRRLATHGFALLSNMQGHHRAFVTRKDGMTGIVTFDWTNVLSKLDRLEQQAEYDAAHPGQVAARAAPAQQASPTPPAPDRTIPADLNGWHWMSGRTFRLTNGDHTTTAYADPAHAIADARNSLPAPVGDPLPPALLALAMRDLDATLPADLRKAGYYWHSATPPTIAHNSGWKGDAPTIELALDAARLHHAAKGAPVTIVLTLTAMECKALCREAALFLKAGCDRRFPTIWQALTIATARALEATDGNA